ncbi:protein kinase C theta type-like [Pelobates fuscus]|uniref:protein kinase C theta type-like n=1 Tax=Pelobates fuscus TaxID=191477 RepID=UPI002FE456AD
MKRTRKRSWKKTEDSQETSDELKQKYRKLNNSSKQQISLGHSSRKRSRSCNEQDIERGREPKRRFIAEERSRDQGLKRYRTSSHDQEEQVIQKRAKVSSFAKLGQKSERKSAGKNGQTSPPRKQALKRSREYDRGEQLMRKRPKLSSSAKLGQKSERKKEEANEPTSDSECGTGESRQSVVEPKKPLPLTISGYQIHKVLGEGGFGKVMLASTKECPTKYIAIKQIDKDRVEEKEIQKEKRILQMASGSPFLCQGLAAFQSQEHAYLVMEYVPGGTLKSYMTGRESLPLAQARFFSASLVCGIQFLHSCGILHGDLKPGNILLDAKGCVKIADFGLSKENIFTHTTTKGLAGTPHYMAPEILSYKRYGQPADWWSFGIILCRMITGQYPFNKKLGRVEYIKKVLSSNPCYPAWLWSDPKDLLNKLLEKDTYTRGVMGRHIRVHPFYRDINWEDLEKGEVSCPFLAFLTRDLDTETSESSFSF